MKKIIVIAMMALLLMNVALAQTDDPEIKATPDERWNYFWQVNLPEWFSITFEPDREVRVEKRLEFLEKRRLEFDALIDKWNEETDEAKKARLDEFLERTEERRAALLDRIDKDLPDVSTEVRIDVLEMIEKHKDQIEAMKARLPALAEKARALLDSATITVERIEGDQINSLFIDACGTKGAEVGQITVTATTDNLNLRARLPACLCESDSQCPDAAPNCVGSVGDKTLAHSVCVQDEARANSAASAAVIGNSRSSR